MSNEITSDPHSRALELFWAQLLLGTVFALLTSYACSIGPWTHVAAGRMWFGLVFALVMARSVWRRLFEIPEYWARVRIAAAALGAPMTYYAFANLGAAEAVTLMQTGPVFALILHTALKRERPSRVLVVCVVSGVCGIVVLKEPSFDTGSLAVLAALFNGACRGVAITSAGRLSRTDPTIMVFYASFAAALTSTALVGVMEQTTTVLVPELTAIFYSLLVFIALVVTLAGVFATKALTLGEASRLMPLFYVGPALTLCAELLWNHRLPEVRELVSMVLILVPAAYISANTSRTKGIVDVHSKALAEIDIHTIAERGPTLIGSIESRALVEIRLHVEGSHHEDERSYVQSLFQELGLEDASRGHGLLICLFASTQNICLVMGHFVEQRLDARILEHHLKHCTTMDEIFEVLEDAIVKRMGNTSARSNEIGNEITFRGFD